MHRDLGMDFAVGRDGRPMRRRGEVRPTRGPGKSGGKTTLPIYSERRPNQYMQAFFGERCLEPGNPNRRSPKISDPRVGPVCAMHRELRSDGGEIEAGSGACREAGRARPPWVKSRQRARCTQHLCSASICVYQPLRAIDRELGTARLIGGVARRWRRRRMMPRFSHRTKVVKTTESFHP